MFDTLKQINWTEPKTIMTQRKFVYKSNIKNGRYAEKAGQDFIPTMSQRVQMALNNLKMQMAQIQHRAIMNAIERDFE